MFLSVLFIFDWLYQSIRFLHINSSAGAHMSKNYVTKDYPFLISNFSGYKQHLFIFNFDDEKNR